MNHHFLYLMLCCIIGINTHTNEVHFTISQDPIVRHYIDALYEDAFSTETVYLLQKPQAMFFEKTKDDPQIYFGTGFVGPEFQISETESGICITYGTYFLMHEVYLEHLLEHPEDIIFEESHKNADAIAQDVQAQILRPLPAHSRNYLSFMADDAEIFIERGIGEYCATPSSFVRNSNDDKNCYIISSFLAELLFKNAQKENLGDAVFDDMVYLYRVFNDRSHWTVLDETETTFFNQHNESPLNGGFLSDMQTKVLFEQFIEKGLFAGIFHTHGVQVYIDISGFMLGANKYAILAFQSAVDKKICFIVSPHIIHMISKAQAKPFFNALTPVVAKMAVF